MSRVRFTPAAQRDVFALWEYIAADDVVAADRVVGEIEAATELLMQMPRIGRIRPELADDRHRFWTVRSWLIVYRHGVEGLTVVRVLHGARDVARALGEDE